RDAAEHAVEPVLRRLLGSKAQGTLEEVDGRVQACVLKLRRATPLDDRGSHLALDQLTEDVFLQRLDQPRLAQARLADHDDHLAHSLLRPLPVVLEKAYLVVATGQRRQMQRRRGCERAGGRQSSLDAIELDRSGQSPDSLVAETGALELVSEQLACDV